MFRSDGREATRGAAIACAVTAFQPERSRSRMQKARQPFGPLLHRCRLRRQFGRLTGQLLLARRFVPSPPTESATTHRPPPDDGSPEGAARRVAIRSRSTRRAILAPGYSPALSGRPRRRLRSRQASSASATADKSTRSNGADADGEANVCSPGIVDRRKTQPERIVMPLQVRQRPLQRSRYQAAL